MHTGMMFPIGVHGGLVNLSHTAYIDIGRQDLALTPQFRAEVAAICVAFKCRIMRRLCVIGAVTRRV